MSSFKKLVAGTVLATTASLGVISPTDVKATPSPTEDWAYVTDAEPCVPRLSVSDNVVDNTIRIQVAEGNTCPVSGNLFIFIQDDRPQPLRLRAIYSQDSTWVVNYDGVRPGRYRVMGVSPTPSGIGDYSYLTSQELGIDQVITIGTSPTPQASVQPQPVDPPPQVVVPPQRVVTTLDSESKQLLRTFDQWMRWFQVNIWPQLRPLIRAIEGIKTS
jgi:hypothetical protein